MKVGLMGFGRTGKLVAEEIIKDSECELKWVLRKSYKNEGEYASDLLGLDSKQGFIYSIRHLGSANLLNINPIDIIIDFSSPYGINNYLNMENTKIVSAVPNYPESGIERLKELSKYTAVLHSPNITLGINFLIQASKLLQKIIPQADIEIVEEHFREKKDVSGTAKKIANILGLDEKRNINPVRAGGIVGKHEIIFGLQNQVIRLTHESISRAAFGQGALHAAKWLADKPKGLYTMEQVLGFDKIKMEG